MKRPTIDEAVELVKALYVTATQTKHLSAIIKNPVAWALYEAWKIADRANGERREK